MPQFKFRQLDKQQLLASIRAASRKIVVHHCHLINNIMCFLNDNDLVFFDDCLYSQYCFIKDNNCYMQKHNMSCILGFSANLYRRHSQNPVYSVKSADLHEAVHMYGESKCNGFMSLDELDELN